MILLCNVRSWELGVRSSKFGVRAMRPTSEAHPTARSNLVGTRCRASLKSLCEPRSANRFFPVLELISGTRSTGSLPNRGPGALRALAE